MIPGVDVSGWQHPGGAPISWPAVAASGIKWAAIKVTQGTDYVNPWLPQDAAEARRAGVYVVGYHFAGWGDPRSEARWFRSHWTGPAALDIETTWNPGWIAVFRDALNIPPAHLLVYGSLDTVPHDGSAPWPLWVPTRDMADPPTVPGMVAWQPSSTGSVHGIVGQTDTDAWLADELPEWVTGVVDPAPPPAERVLGRVSIPAGVEEIEITGR